MKVSELESPFIDYWVAKVEDLDAQIGTCSGWGGQEDLVFQAQYCWVGGGDIYNPSEDWSACGPLIEKYNIEFHSIAISSSFEIEAHYHVRDNGKYKGCYIGKGRRGEHCKAACRAIVASKYGEEVPDIKE